MANIVENLKVLHSLSSLIPEYHGDQSTLSDFISACDFVFEQIDENLVQGFLFVVKNKLLGKAKQFISSRNINDWESVKQLLIGHFGDCRDTESLLRDLTACVQKPNETPRVFVQRIEDLLTKLRNVISLDVNLNNVTKQVLNNSHEKIALKTVLAGLGDPIGSIIRSQRPGSIDEAIHFLIEEENIYYLKNKNSSRENKQSSKIVPKSNFSHDFKRENKFCSYCKNPGHIIADCRKRAFNNQQRNGLQNSTRPTNFSSNNNYNPDRPPGNQAGPSTSFNRPIQNNNYNRPSVIQRNPQINHLNSQEGTEMGSLSLNSQSPENVSDVFQSLTF